MKTKEIKILLVGILIGMVAGVGSVLPDLIRCYSSKWGL